MTIATFDDKEILRNIVPGHPDFPADGKAEVLTGPGKGKYWEWTPGDHSGIRAIGSITLLSKGTAGHSVNIDGWQLSLKAGTFPLPIVSIGDDAQETAANLRAAINALADDDSSFPVTAVAGDTNEIVRLRARKKGLSGNIVALSISHGAQTSFRLSGPLLADGKYSAVEDRYMVETRIGPNGTSIECFDAEMILVRDNSVGNDGAWVFKPDADLTYDKPKITPDFFGIYDPDLPEENRRILQAAVEASSRSTWVVELDGDDPLLIDGEWLVDGYIRLTDGCDLRGKSGTTNVFKLVSVSEQGPGYRAPVKLGGWSNVWVPNSEFGMITDEDYWRQYVEWHDCTWIDSSTLLLAQSVGQMIPVGSTILIRDMNFYHSAGQGQIPQRLMANERVDPSGTTAGTTTIKLATPFEYTPPHSAPSLQVALGTCPVSLRDEVDFYVDGNPPSPRLYGLKRGAVLRDHAGQRGFFNGSSLSVAKRVKVSEISLESRGNPGATPDPVLPGPVFAIGSAAYDCDLQIIEAKGSSSVYLNCFSYSTLAIGYAEAWEKVVELALGGGDSTISIDTAIATEAPTGGVVDIGSIVNFGENVNGTTVAIGLLEVTTDYAESNGLVTLRAASNCEAAIDSLTLSGLSPWTGAVIAIENDLRTPVSGDPRETQNATANNGITIASASVGPCRGYVIMDNGGGQLDGATIKGYFDIGLIGTTTGLLLRGSNVNVRGTILMGNVDVTDTINVDVEIASDSPGSQALGEGDATNPHVVIDPPPAMMAQA